MEEEGNLTIIGINSKGLIERIVIFSNYDLRFSTFFAFINEIFKLKIKLTSNIISNFKNVFFPLKLLRVQEKIFIYKLLVGLIKNKLPT